MSRGREMVFPPNCVESTQPLLMKRRKHSKVDVQPVEGWKLVMSLRSGLLMESTWALDVVNVLLYDDNAFPYFGLGNMPGLFEALMEHWRASLIAMFGLTEDMEAGGSRRSDGERSALAAPASVLAIASSAEGEDEEWTQGRKQQQKRKWWERDIKPEEDIGELELGCPGRIDPSARAVIIPGNSNNYTKRPRFGEEDVIVQEKEDELFVTDVDEEDEEEGEEGRREWDESCDGIRELTSEHWRLGGGNTTRHIVAPFQADLGIVPFVRLLKELGREKKEAEDSKVKEEPTEIKTEPGEEGEEAEKKPEEEEEPEDIVDKIHRMTGIVLRDPDAARQRWREENLEEECYMRDEPSLHLTSEKQDGIARRAVCVSTILRNLSFLPGNEFEFGRSAAFLTVAGRLLLLCHWYPQRTARQRNYDRGGGDEEQEQQSSGGGGGPFSSLSSQSSEGCSSLADGEWWWDYLHVIRENVMVALANVSGALELRHFDESVARPILHGLLEWAVSSSSYAQDAFPYMGAHSLVSPQRLAVETLCKLCVHETNVDLLLATPPFSRIERLTRLLARRLYKYEEQVLREFSINLLYYLSGADTGMARCIALKADQTVGLLLGFIEQAEANAMMVAQQHGVNALRDNPDTMGTSLDMLRRAASTLHNLSGHPQNVPLFVKHEQRLLALVMSQILDQGVAAILSNVLFHIGQEQEELQRQWREAEEKRAAARQKEAASASDKAEDKDGSSPSEGSKEKDGNSSSSSSAEDKDAKTSQDSSEKNDRPKEEPTENGTSSDESSEVTKANCVSAEEGSTGSKSAAPSSSASVANSSESSNSKANSNSTTPLVASVS